MTEQPVLRRKLVRPRPPPVPDPPVSDLARTLPRALVRAVSAVASLTAEVGAVTEARLSLDELLDRIAEDGFVALLTPVQGGGGTGLAVLQQPLFSGLIEAMTLGRLSARPPEPRRPTATDSALLGAVLNQTLAELAPCLAAEMPEGQDGASRLAGRWQMLRAVSDLRLLGALLDEGGYRMLHAAVRLGGNGAAREGAVAILLPVSLGMGARAGKGGGPARLSGAPGSLRTEGAFGGGGGAGITGAGGAEDPFQQALERAVLNAPVQLDSVLGRVQMTLTQAMALRVGHRLELPLSQLEEVEVAGLDGAPQARARLGQSRGMRALRIVALCTPADPGAAGPEDALTGPGQGGFLPGQPPSRMYRSDVVIP